MSAAEFLPDPTCPCEFSPRSVALAANSGEVSTQPMHVSPSTDIAVTNKGRQSIKATTCGRQVAALDFQPSCLNNPLGLQNSVTALQNIWLSLAQDPLRIWKSAVGCLESRAT